MFKIPRVNVIESDDGFSIKVEMTRILYTEGDKRLYMYSEIEASPGNIAIWKESIRNWEPPYENELIDENKRDAIVENIRRAFRWKGESIDVV
ncbi:MAG: Imm74 family immunity protein [Anaerolineales bacterium]